MEIGLDATKLEVMTQTEQNVALRQQVQLLKGQSSHAERKMMEINAEMARQGQIKDDMAMKLREMENIVSNTVNREVNLGIKERQLEQVNVNFILIFWLFFICELYFLISCLAGGRLQARNKRAQS